MIHYTEGNLLESKAQALVNTVNLDGVMGKGIALQFKKQFPENFKAYKKACDNNEIAIGQSFVYVEETLLNGKKIIINFPTKTTWRKPSEYKYIEVGLENLVNIIHYYNIKSIAIPPLGAGNGGLDWGEVKKRIEYYLKDVDCEILVYQPTTTIEEKLNKEKVSLTPARAMLLAVLYDLVKQGEFVSEFSAEKVAYFLQKFGAREEFNLQFNAQHYGPYSGKVRHVLYYLNGSYITGYISKDKKPFEILGVNLGDEGIVLDYLNSENNKKYLDIVNRTQDFLSGYYSNFGLELLSTIDFIQQQKGVQTIDEISDYLKSWNLRKQKLFVNNPMMIELGVKHLAEVNY
ncbi:MAG: macro domain-containing protein [Flavobacteriaceae bacterium]|jgi:O-acetyl-ADP-ribose deacetylase (regulator of RNase III)|nr:macro domain-containing protein [Flavobacteriaceae bacterium]